MKTQPNQSDISDYFLIGDLHSSALVSRNASIDWMCWPQFDSPSIFAKLLDKNAGSFSLDTSGLEIEASYIENNAVVNYRVLACDFTYDLFDYMIPQPLINCQHHYLIRRLQADDRPGSVRFIFEPKFNYATEAVEPVVDNNLLIYKFENDHEIILSGPEGAKFERRESGWSVEYDFSAGEECYFALMYTDPDEHELYPVEKSLDFTTEFWRDWLSQGEFFEFDREAIVRSAITLKLLQYYPTGAIIAAPTTSIPEAIGGARNWDYRFTWVRDATFIIYALFILKFKDEARDYFNFISKIIDREKSTGSDLGLMYTIDGEPVKREQSLDHLEGYQNSKPIRIGNNAGDQFQLDTYGILLDAFYFMSKHDFVDINDYPGIIEYLADAIIRNWQKKDNGIWEVRGELQHYTYSKVICWVGLNRLSKIKDKLSISEDKLKLYQETEKQIYEWIWDNCYDSDRQIFTMHPETTAIDASNLLFTPLQFLDRHEESTKQIILNTYENLKVDDIFINRYKIDDGFTSHEGAFLLCSQWLSASLSSVGEHEKALHVFKGIDKIMNNQKLLSEEYDPQKQQYLGNYPQAFSHIGHIFSAYYMQTYAPDLINKEVSGNK